MSLLELGINHTSASLDVREKVAFSPDEMVEALEDALSQANLSEVVILSTCNRTEIIAASDDNDAGEAGQRAMEWLATYHHVRLSELQQCCYFHHDEEALRHAIRVASGLASMVLGEPQILGQIKADFSVATAGKISFSISL